MRTLNISRFYITFSLAVVLSFLSTSVLAIDTRIVESSGTIDIQIKRSGSSSFNLNSRVINYTVTLKYDSSYGNLSASVNSFANLAFAPTSTVISQGQYKYLILYVASSPTVSATFGVTGSYKSIANISINGGSGTGTFEISNDLVPASQKYYWEVDAHDSTGTFDSAPITSVSLGTSYTWTGDLDNDWNTIDNWDEFEVPTEHQGAIIPSSVSSGNYPILTGDVSIKDLDLESGAIIRIADNTFTVRESVTGTGTFVGSSNSILTFTGSTASTLLMNQDTVGSTNLLKNLIVNNSAGLSIGNATRVSGILTLTSGTVTSAGNLTLAATSKYQYGQIANSGTGTISGNIAIEKVLNDTTEGWRNFSLPLTGSLANLSGIDLLYSNHSTAAERNIYKWDASDAGSGSSVGWTSASSSDDETNGYLLYSERGSSSIHNIDTLISYTGTYSSSDFDFDFYTSVDPDGTGADATGWNNVPNPWPSNIDLDEVFASSFFTGISYKAIHMWDATSAQYIAKCSTSVSITNYNTNGGTTTTNILQPFQAFWVKSDLGGSGATQRTLPGTVRTTDTTGMGKYFKKSYDLLRLNVLDKDSAWDQTVIYFANEATKGLDLQFDAYKLISLNENVPSLYSVDAGTKLAINALDENRPFNSIPLGFKTNKTGDISFFADFTDLDPNTHVYLEDKLLAGYHNLRESSYIFSATPMDSKDRFVLHFMPNALSTDQLISERKEIKVSGDGTEVFVFVPDYFSNQKYAIEVIDMMGKVVYSNNSTELNSGTNRLSLNNLKSGYYSVKVSSNEVSTSAKVFIR